MELSDNDLMIIKDTLLHYWEEFRPEGDQAGLYDRVIAELGKRNGPQEVDR